MSELPPSLKARVLASREATSGTNHGAWERRRWVALVVVVAWISAGVALIRTREDWGQLPGWYQVASLLLASGTGLGLLVLVFWRGRYLTGPPVRVVRVLSVVLPLLTIAWGALGIYPAAAGGWAVEGPKLLHCHAFSMLISLPPLALLFWLRRGLTLAAPGLLGACLGASIAAWSQVVLFVGCSTGSAIHMSLGHAMPSLPLMGIGALVGLRAFR